MLTKVLDMFMDLATDGKDIPSAHAIQIRLSILANAIDLVVFQNEVGKRVSLNVLVSLALSNSLTAGASSRVLQVPLEVSTLGTSEYKAVRILLEPKVKLLFDCI